jgi:hypothetical protein
VTSAPRDQASRAITTSPIGFLDASTWTHFQNAERLAYRADIVRKRLREIRQVPNWSAALGRNAYWHSNGFVKIKIVETPGFCIRLHIWPPGEHRLGEVDPHNHRWEFASWVAIGEGIQERRFDVVADDDSRGMSYTRYAYGREDGVSYLRPEGRSRLRETLRLRREPGHVYSCPPDVLHTVAPIGNGLVATVVLQGPLLKKPAVVYRCPERSGAALQGSISVEELDQLFAEVEGRIAARSPVSHWAEWAKSFR